MPSAGSRLGYTEFYIAVSPDACTLATKDRCLPARPMSARCLLLAPPRDVQREVSPTLLPQRKATGLGSGSFPGRLRPGAALQRVPCQHPRLKGEPSTDPLLPHSSCPLTPRPPDEVRQPSRENASRRATEPKARTLCSIPHSGKDPMDECFS